MKILCVLVGALFLVPQAVLLAAEGEKRPLLLLEMKSRGHLVLEEGSLVPLEIQIESVGKTITCLGLTQSATTLHRLEKKMFFPDHSSILVVCKQDYLLVKTGYL